MLASSSSLSTRDRHNVLPDVGLLRRCVLAVPVPVSVKSSFPALRAVVQSNAVQQLG